MRIKRPLLGLYLLAAVAAPAAHADQPEPPSLNVNPAFHGLLQPGQPGTVTVTLLWPGLAEQVRRDIAPVANVGSARQPVGRTQGGRGVLRMPEHFSGYLRFKPTRGGTIEVPDFELQVDGHALWAPGSEVPVMNTSGAEEDWGFGVVPARVRQGGYARLVAAHWVPEGNKKKREALVKKLRDRKIDAKPPKGLQFHGGGAMVRNTGKGVLVQHIWTVRAKKAGRFRFGGKAFGGLPDGVEAPELTLIIDPPHGRPKDAPPPDKLTEPRGERPTLDVMLSQRAPIAGDNCMIALRLDIPRLRTTFGKALPRADWQEVGHRGFASDAGGQGLWLRFAFRPEHPGLVQLGPYEVEIDGHVVRSEPLVLRVQEPWPIADGDGYRLYIERDQVRVGEMTHLWIVRRAQTERGKRRPSDKPLRKIKLKPDPRFDVGNAQYATWYESGREQRQVARFPIKPKTPDLIELTRDAFEHLPKGVEVRDVMIDVLPRAVADAAESSAEAVQ